MDPKRIAKQTFDFYKSTFNNTFNAMTMLQEQTQKVMDMYLEQTSGFPEEGKKAYKKGSEDFKKAVDESFKRVEDFFSEAGKPAKKE